MHRPEPLIPSSHCAHPSGHFWHWGPKKPVAHTSHDAPVNPGAHAQVPEAVHSPEAEQGEEQVLDCISMRVRALDPAGGGSWEMSGTESHIMTRFEELDEDEEGWTAIQTLEEMARDLAVSGVEDVNGAEGREANAELLA
jgi:hypothetical protein